jgi:Ion channel
MPLLSGLVLLVVTVVVHAVGTTYWVGFLVHRYSNRRGVFEAKVALRMVIWTVLTLSALHVAEIILWAFAYLLLLPDHQLKTLEEAAYFSIVTFTSLGYGDVALTAVYWRLLSGIEALNGVLLLGWSTALLFAVMQRIWLAYEGGGAAD